MSCHYGRLSTLKSELVLALITRHMSQDMNACLATRDTDVGNGICDTV